MVPLQPPQPRVEPPRHPCQAELGAPSGLPLKAVGLVQEELRSAASLGGGWEGGGRGGGNPSTPTPCPGGLRRLHCPRLWPLYLHISSP